MEAEEAKEAPDKRRRWSGPNAEWMDSHGRDMNERGDENVACIRLDKLHCCVEVAVYKSIGACPVACECVICIAM